VKHASAIVAKHRQALLGPLAKAVGAAMAVFEKGSSRDATPASAASSRSTRCSAGSSGATVTHLHVTKYGALDAKMRALVEAVGVPDSGIACLATATFPHLEVLGLATPEGAKDGLKAGKPSSVGLRALANATGLPKLREVRLELSPIEWRYEDSIRPTRYERDADDYAWLLAAPFANQLDTLHVTFHAATSLGSWLRVTRARSHLQRIVAHGPDFDVVLTATSGELRPRADPSRRDLTAQRAEIRAALVGLPVREP
jgi:hypothetical protein